MLEPMSIEFWRSEALVALSATKYYEEVLAKAAPNITREAGAFLEPLLLHKVSGAMSAFHRDITMPAINLASKMRQSTTKYHFIFRVASNKYEDARPSLLPLRKYSPLYKADLEYVDVFDVRSGNTLNKQRHYEEAKDGSIAKSILVVHPALYRRGATEDILLSKQVVLAEMFKPPQREGQPRDVEDSWAFLNWINGLSS